MGGGRKSNIPTFADELVLILLFYRNYLVYEVIGFLFNLDISNVTRHIDIFEKTLSKLAQYKLAKPKGVKRIRTIKEFYEKFPELDELIGDATEQVIERPKKENRQKKYYSGKKKRHPIKVQIVINKNKRIYDVSKSYPGSLHDKSIMIKEKTPEKIPKYSKTRIDNAYHKIQKEYPEKTFIFPQKANRWHKLTKTQKKNNKIKASRRITIEHLIARLKSFKILSHKFRHNVVKHNRIFRNICAINNFRLDLARLS